MSQFMPEAQQPEPQQQKVDFAAPATDSSGDVALMQRIFRAAVQNPNLIPTDFMAYVLDYIQIARLEIPIGQVFGYERIATQVVTSLASVPSPVDGQQVVLKTGASAPFTYTPLSYDGAAQQWVSPEFSFGGGSSTLGVSSTSPVPAAPSAAISWSPVHLGGLKLQVKWAGSLNTSNTGAGHEAHGGVYLTFVDGSGGVSAATYSDKHTTAPALSANVFADWADVTDPGNYAVVMSTIYGYLGTTGDAGGAQGAITARFVK